MKTLKQFLKENEYEENIFTTKKDILEFFKDDKNETRPYITPTMFLTDTDFAWTEFLELQDIENLKGDFEMLEENNTYNFGGYARNEINYFIFKDNEKDNSYLAISFHIGYDIRGGYTDYILLKNNSDYDLICHLNYPIPLKELEYNNKEYVIDGSMSNEELTIYCTTTDESIDYIYFDIENDEKIIELIKEYNI